ncbi:hypothetical protein GGF37_006881, partial [Kickxella alabastrina]
GQSSIKNGEWTLNTETQRSLVNGQGPCLEKSKEPTMRTTAESACQTQSSFEASCRNQRLGVGNRPARCPCACQTRDATALSSLTTATHPSTATFLAQTSRSYSKACSASWQSNETWSAPQPLR